MTRKAQGSGNRREAAPGSGGQSIGPARSSNAQRNGGPGPRALIRTLGILESVAAHPEGLSLTQLSVALKSPKSSLLALLRPLTDSGYVMHADSRYSTGPAAYRLALSLFPMLSLSQTAKPAMRELAEATGETTLIAILDRGAMRTTYVEKVESANPIRYSVDVGLSRPLYCSAAGKLLLAYEPDEAIETYIRETKFEALTKRTLTDPDQLRRSLTLTRAQGLATTVGEVSDDVAGFSVPLFNHEGTVIAALTVGAPVNRAKANGPRIVRLLTQAASRISQAIGAPKVRQAEPDSPTTGARERLIGVAGAGGP